MNIIPPVFDFFDTSGFSCSNFFRKFTLKFSMKVLDLFMKHSYTDFKHKFMRTNSVLSDK